METTELKRVHLGATTEIELPRLDVTQYIGRRALIDRVEECEGDYGYFVRVETQPVDTIGQGEKLRELRASQLFGLQKDALGKVGWGKNSKMGKFLEKMNVPHYRDLVGREVIVQTRTSKDGMDFLTF